MVKLAPMLLEDEALEAGFVDGGIPLRESVANRPISSLSAANAPCSPGSLSLPRNVFETLQHFVPPHYSNPEMN
jgi:hypothetical protein